MRKKDKFQLNKKNFKFLKFIKCKKDFKIYKL